MYLVNLMSLNLYGFFSDKYTLTFSPILLSGFKYEGIVMIVVA